jgi:hypothetical protein
VNPGVMTEIVGEWNWVAGQTLIIDSDGTCRVYQGVAQINSCRWVVLDAGRRQVRITHERGGWIDTVTLSPDGRVLTGTNQHGNPLRGDRNVGPGILPPNAGLTTEMVGEWNWVAGQRLVVDADGTCRVYQGVAQINSCRWVVLDESRRRVRITHARGGWIDTMTLSPDGRVLTGTNNVGSTIRGDRASGSLVLPPNAGVTGEIVGKWNWVAGQTLVIEANGTCRVYQGLAQINSCRWVVLDEGLREVRITHAQGGWVDTLTLSPDGRVLTGTNQNGNPLRGEKTTDG